MVLAGWERMQYIGGEGGIVGALDAAQADALIFPSIVSSDVPSMAGHPVIIVTLGFMNPDTPIKRNLRGNLVEEGPGVPYVLLFLFPAPNILLFILGWRFSHSVAVLASASSAVDSQSKFSSG
jgi:hypothetical protein